MTGLITINDVYHGEFTQMNKKVYLLLLSSLCLCKSLYADTITTQVYSSENKLMGNIVFKDSQYGLLITPNLKGLPQGVHGFHIHEHADCGDHAMKAGDHLDPNQAGKHLGPYSEGHLGDLPTLVVNDHGVANTPVLAPRLKVSDIKNHAIMIHAGGDNYSDKPTLGGGGARIACGKIL